DPALLVAARRRGRAWAKAVVLGQLEQRRIEADREADALGYCALEVVVEQVPRDTAEVLESVDVAAQEARHASVEEEPKKHTARMAQCHHEAEESPNRVVDIDLAKMGPVDLGLLARQHRQTREGFGFGSRSQIPD